MINSSVMFACTSLVGVNKVGDLKKNENGYYPMVVGALNAFNSSGQFYDYDQARQLFEESSSFMRRIKRAALRGEYGHPKPPARELDMRLQRIREEEFARRCLTIDESNVCCHHMRIYLDFDSVKDKQGKPVISIMSEVAPNGPIGHVLEKQLENKHENVCFSIRAFTNNTYMRGVEVRVLREIVTFDYVNEPGIATAEKYNSPALEELQISNFSRAMLEDALYKQRPSGISMESTIVNGDSLFNALGWDRKDGSRIATPSYLKW
jgi:hypothetical protein